MFSGMVQSYFIIGGDIGKKKNAFKLEYFWVNHIVFYYEQTNPIKRLINSPGRVIALGAKILDWLNE